MLREKHLEATILQAGPPLLDGRVSPNEDDMFISSHLRESTAEHLVSPHACRTPQGEGGEVKPSSSSPRAQS